VHEPERISEPERLSPSAADLAAAFKAKYPMVPAENWKGLLKKVKANPPDATRSACSHG
jgi:hypothetical protein